MNSIEKHKEDKEIDIRETELEWSNERQDIGGLKFERKEKFVVIFSKESGLLCK